MLRWIRNKWKRDLATLRERREKERRERKILCPRCGYDMKGMPDLPCSECGLVVESSWRGNWLGAGSPLRCAFPVAIAAAAIHFMLVASAVLAGQILIIRRTPGLLEILPPHFWVTNAAIGTNLLVCLGALATAIRRRRWLIFGPRRYALLTLGATLALLYGTWAVAVLLMKHAPNA